MNVPAYAVDDTSGDTLRDKPSLRESALFSLDLARNNIKRSAEAAWGLAHEKPGLPGIKKASTAFALAIASVGARTQLALLHDVRRTVVPENERKDSEMNVTGILLTAAFDIAGTALKAEKRVIEHLRREKKVHQTPVLF